MIGYSVYISQFTKDAINLQDLSRCGKSISFLAVDSQSILSIVVCITNVNSLHHWLQWSVDLVANVLKDKGDIFASTLCAKQIVMITLQIFVTIVVPTWFILSQSH